MHKVKRKELLLKKINIEKVIETKVILNYISDFNINSSTARRDLKELENECKINIFFGLIKSIEDDKNLILRSEQKYKEINKKENIAKEAIKLLEKCDNIFCGPGTTVEAFVRKINRKIKLLVTNSFPVFLEGWKNDNVKDILLIGGIFRENSQVFWNKDAKKYLEGIKFSHTFFSCFSVDCKGNIYDNFIPEANILKEVMTKSCKKILLVDSTKFMKKVGAGFMNIKEIDILVTDFSDNNNFNDFLEPKKIIYSMIEQENEF
ncbi:DeoR/GlpR family DNA-binding transcription regulator [Spiroplasma floricola]|uniref:DeoR family transcriptional regulator, lactose phosphotransferase system repressor n=1 Tax=Spiroplasma floricola 23-6 TaxID=1336749 RepID=A0A2K8SE26_9MOLU|nr:DeoR/GlpR family DNA-binding transcription regulator [Spiroplasma floricola]AUB31717.1 DeoR family transcriptional regulator, lactose phosphotransferase system repressor [Spiroplasma floricola 23-6]